MTVVASKRNRRVVAGLVGVSVVSAFVACSGSAEHRNPREGGQAGQWSGVVAGEAGAEQGGNSALEGSGGTSQGGATDGGDGGRAAGAGGESNQAAGAGGVGGQDQGGAPSEGGASGAGGDSSGGAGGEGPFVDPVCGVGKVQVGAYSLWCGKVNMHFDAESGWLHDSDCTSGCNVSGVGYCQKFYPTATSVVTVPQLETKDWKNAGCADSAPDGAGISGQAACCAPF
jgi:hypothetical protein